jgi:hypothetical protein
MFHKTAAFQHRHASHLLPFFSNGRWIAMPPATTSLRAPVAISESLVR